MTKEIPLSLQVFHSLNEYKAHRRNRTEQLRLRDTEGILKREKQLYAKEFSLNKNKFHAHYARSFADPAVSSSALSRLTRSSSRASVFSAPASLNHISKSSPLASRMYESISEISTSSRFQRIQRKFSIASFTENGLLTKKGSSFAKDIGKARQMLFKNWTPDCERTKSELVSLVEEEEDEDEEENDMDDGGGTSRPDSGSIKKQSNVTKRPDSSHSECFEPFEGNNDNNNQRQHTTNINGSRHTPISIDSIDNNRDRQTTNSRIKPQSPKPVLKSGRRDGTEKRVTIQLPGRPKSVVEAQDEDDILTQANNNSGSRPLSSCSIDNDGSFADWKSIFSRPINAARMDPLQAKIKLFLEKQAQFNKSFPKGPSGSMETTGIHKELLEKQKRKKEKEKKEKQRKQEIITEVLETLKITDKHILFHYKG